MENVAPAPNLSQVTVTTFPTITRNRPQVTDDDECRVNFYTGNL